MADAPGFNREFDAGGGIVIDLRTVREGGRTGVLESLRSQLIHHEDEAERIEGELQKARANVSALELGYARANAYADAAQIAYDAAKKAFA